MAKRNNGNGKRGPSPQGTLIIIGGHEEKDGEALILKAVAERAKGGKLVVATLATREPEEMFRDYRKAFTALGVKHIEHLNVSDREALLKNPPLDFISGQFGGRGVGHDAGPRLRLMTGRAGSCF